MLERLSSPDQPQHQTICFTYWLPWHLSKQLKSASEFARQHQIALKGDLPIGTHTHISTHFHGSGAQSITQLVRTSWPLTHSFLTSWLVLCYVAHTAQDAGRLNPLQKRRRLALSDKDTPSGA